MPKLLAPFPYFGGKSKVAPAVWRALGKPHTYVEPFGGSLAVLLARPGGAGKLEVVGDADGYIANFWRAITADPNAVYEAAQWPAIEQEIHARSRYMMELREELTAKLEADIDYHDAKLAGWWAWGQSVSIGGNWLATKGLNAKPHIARAMGTMAGRSTRELFGALASRLARVRVVAGDWRRTVMEGTTEHLGPWAIFMDPPYCKATGEGRSDGAYNVGDSFDVSAVREWALEHGERPGVRVALCDFAGAHEMPGWSVHEWDSGGAAARSASGEETRGQRNAKRERIWLSPQCLPVDRQMGLAL